MERAITKRVFVLLMWFTVLVASGVQAQQNQLLGVRIWPAPDMTRLVFDISSPVEHSLFTLPKPDRVVIDLKNVEKHFSIKDIDYSKGFIKDIRSASREGGKNMRIVLDLSKEVKPHSYLLEPHGRYGHRLVIELQQKVKKRW